MSQSFAVAWYRFRKTFPRQWSGYLSVVLLIGLIGGLAMASVAASRRTQSSYPTYLASTNPSTLDMTAYEAGGLGNPGPTLTKVIKKLPYVLSVHTAVTPIAAPLTPSGAPRFSFEGSLLGVGSMDGYYTDVDRLTLVQGHLADPSSTNEIELTAQAARELDVHVGEVIPIGYYSQAQEALPGFGTPAVKPKVRVSTRVTGIVVLNSQLIQDDVDRTWGFVFFTQAETSIAHKVDPSYVVPYYYAMQLRQRDQHLAQVERELVSILPKGMSYTFHVTATYVGQAELTVKPESVALAAFGAIAALICLILSVQALSRLLRRGGEERRTLRALGASPQQNLFDGLIPAAGAVIAGTLVAIIVTVVLSPLAPIGPVRPVYPHRGVSFDWTVLGAGAGVLVLVLGLAAFAMARPHSPTRRVVQGPSRSEGSLARRVQSLGLPITAGVGIHFALESRRGPSEVPVRSILLGAILAVTLMATTLTFASGFNTLVTHPPLYGWDWNYALFPGSNVPPGALTLLNKDNDVEAWSGVLNYGSVQIDGIGVPMLQMAPRSRVTPPILSGHGLDNSKEIVLGEATLALLHKHVGQSVTLVYGSPSSAPVYVPPTRLKVVGTATFPAVGYSDVISGHTSMGTGALVPDGVLPASYVKAISSKDPNLNGPEMIFVRIRPGVSAAAGHRDMERIARAADAIMAKDPNTSTETLSVLDAQRPAEIINYRSEGSTPVVLAIGLTLGAVVALALTLSASVRRRRRDLALYKTLGFTRRQVAATVAWQASVDAVIGALVGIPLGILLGRELWTLFARSINAVPLPTVPTLALCLVGVGTIVAANLAAAWPGRRAATTPVALVLRAE